MPLTEKLANIVDEAPIIPENGHFSDIESVFKAVTSGGKIKIEPKYENAREARATARCVFAANNLPTLTDRSSGVWDRMRLIPFNQKFRGTDKQNLQLAEELLAELSGIFMWAVRGLVRLHSLTASSAIKTFPQCEDGRLDLEQLREDSDHERTFLRETVKVSADPNEYLETRNLYLRYKDWANEGGYRPVAENKFVTAVKREYPNAVMDRKRIGSSRPTVVYGIDWA
jgi:putative DNA primase/helicase